MKKEKPSSSAKAQKKELRLSIEESLTAKIKQAVNALGQDPKKAKAQIAKASKAIAKKLASKAKIKNADLKKVVKSRGGALTEQPSSEKEPDASPVVTGTAAIISPQPAPEVTSRSTHQSSATPVENEQGILQEKTEENVPDLDDRLGKLD